MSIKRNYYSEFIDTMIFFVITIMISIVVTFFMNIDNDEISAISIVVSVTLSLLTSGMIMIKYFNKFPIGLILEDEKIIIHKFYRKDKIYITDIIKISEVKTLSKLTGSVMYVISYEDSSVLLNNKRYNNLNIFMSNISKLTNHFDRRFDQIDKK